MKRPTNPSWRSRQRAGLAALLAAAALLILAAATASPAIAGTYTISNCPMAGNGDAGAWSVFGSPQNAKGSCDGAGGYIGPQGSAMSPGTAAGVQISAPAGIAILEATVWWQVAHQLSGADMFAIAADNDGAVAESTTPMTGSQPSTWVLPSTTTELTLEGYCANDDYGAGCTLGGGENPILELDGATLTLLDNTPPSGEVTGGSLTSPGNTTATASISFRATDQSSGVRRANLRVDGATVAEQSYAADCSYTTFQACPPTASGTINWDTAKVPDGQHQIEVTIEDAAENATVVYDGQITTENAPSILMAPSISGKAQIGSTLTASPATFTSPEGAGPLSQPSGQWLRCSDTTTQCSPITGANSSTYTPSSNDAGYQLRYQSTASNTDGSTSTESPATVVVTEPASNATTTVETDPTPGAGGTGGTGGSAVGGVSGSSGSLTLNSTAGGTAEDTAWKVSLNVSRKHVRQGTKIKLDGQVSTKPRPAKDKLVYLRARSVAIVAIKGKSHEHRDVRAYGKWITFAALRTRRNGSFSATHRFHLTGKHRYQFIAVVPDISGNNIGRSKIAKVTEN